MVTRASGRPGTGGGRHAGRALFVALSAAVAIVAAAPGRAVAAEDQETPQLWEPEQAVAFLLGTPGSKHHADDDGARRWDGALGPGITRALFGTYRVVLSSQDLPGLRVRPVLLRFSQRAIDRCGPAGGAPVAR